LPVARHTRSFRGCTWRALYLPTAETCSQCVASSRDTAFVEALCVGAASAGSSATYHHTSTSAVHVVLNSLTSPGMLGASLASLAPGGRLVEIGKRDVWSAARVAQVQLCRHTAPAAFSV
jgi:hypothetical protein